MALVWLIAYYVFFAFWLFVIGRLVIEIVRSFARDWKPEGPTAAGLEMLFMVTDPPVKGLRRLIPMVRIGTVSLDLSIMILLLVIWIFMGISSHQVSMYFSTGEFGLRDLAT